MELTRREFAKGGLASLGFLALPGGLFASSSGGILLCRNHVEQVEHVELSACSCMICMVDHFETTQTIYAKRHEKQRKKNQSMDFMYDLARTMSYYKMNVLHVHLNDNAGGKDPNKYAAFAHSEKSCTYNLTTRLEIIV